MVAASCAVLVAVLGLARAEVQDGFFVTTPKASNVRAVAYMNHMPLWTRRSLVSHRAMGVPRDGAEVIRERLETSS